MVSDIAVPWNIVVTFIRVYVNNIYFCHAYKKSAARPKTSLTMVYVPITWTAMFLHVDLYSTVNIFEWLCNLNEHENWEAENMVLYNPLVDKSNMCRIIKLAIP